MSIPFLLYFLFSFFPPNSPLDSTALTDFFSHSKIKSTNNVSRCCENTWHIFTLCSDDRSKRGFNDIETVCVKLVKNKMWLFVFFFLLFFWEGVFCCSVVKKADFCFYERFLHSLHYSIVSEMKPTLHFIAACSVDLCRFLLAFISAEEGSVPDWGWASESHLPRVMISLFSFCCTHGTKLIFFFKNYCSTPFFDPSGLLSVLVFSFYSPAAAWLLKY